MTEPGAALRWAVRRLLAAAAEHAVEVTVRRADLEVLLAVNAHRATLDPAGQPRPPRLHPEQR